MCLSGKMLCENEIQRLLDVVKRHGSKYIPPKVVLSVQFGLDTIS